MHFSYAPFQENRRFNDEARGASTGESVGVVGVGDPAFMPIPEKMPSRSVSTGNPYFSASANRACISVITAAFISRNFRSVTIFCPASLK